MSHPEIDRIRPILEIDDDDVLRELLGFIKSYWWLGNDIPIADEVLDDREWAGLAEGAMASFCRLRPVQARRLKADLDRLEHGDRILAQLKPNPEHFLLWSAEVLQHHRRDDLSRYGSRLLIADAYAELYGKRPRFTPDDQLYWPGVIADAPLPAEPFVQWLKRDGRYWDDPQFQGLIEIYPDQLPDRAMLPLLRLSQVDDSEARHHQVPTWEVVARRYGTRLFPACVAYLADPLRWGEVNAETVYHRRFFDLVADWPQRLAAPLFRAAFASGWNDAARCIEHKTWAIELVKEFKNGPYRSPRLRSQFQAERVTVEQAAENLERDIDRQKQLVAAALGLDDAGACERMHAMLRRAGRLYRGMAAESDDQSFFSSNTHRAFERLRPQAARRLKKAGHPFSGSAPGESRELQRSAGVLTFLYAAEHFRRHRGGINRYRARKLTADAYRSLHGGDLLDLGEEEKLCWLGGKLPQPPVGARYRHFFEIDHGYWEDPQYLSLCGMEARDLPDEAMIPALHFLYQDDTYLRRERFAMTIEELLERYGARLFSPVINYLSQGEVINRTLCYSLKSRLLYGVVAGWSDDLARLFCRSAMASGWHDVDQLCMRGKSWRSSVLGEFGDSPYRR